VDEVRARALEAIGAYDSALVRQAIREAYESDVRRLKVSAVHAMAQFRASLAAVTRRELNNEEAEIRYEAAVACGSLGDEGLFRIWRSWFRTPTMRSGRRASAALGEIGGPGLEALAELKEDYSPAGREAALAALEVIDSKKERPRCRSSTGVAVATKRGGRATDREGRFAGGVVCRSGSSGLEIVICGRDADGVWGLPKGTPAAGESLRRRRLGR